MTDETTSAAHYPKTAPPDTRPYHPAHLPGEERSTRTGTHRQLWRQVGWHGQTGAFYALGEDPSRHEPGSYAPLWLLVDEDQYIAEWERELLEGQTP